MGGVVSVFAFIPPDRTLAKKHEHKATVHLLTDTGDTVPVVGLYPNDKRVRGARLVIIYSHGNAEDLAQGWPELQRVADVLRIPVFGFDYPGYGTATGRTSEIGCFAAARAVWSHVREQEPQARIVLWGRSLGSGPAVHLAATARPAEQASALAGLVLQSPVASCVGTVLGKPGVSRAPRREVWGRVGLAGLRYRRTVGRRCLSARLHQTATPQLSGALSPAWRPASLRRRRSRRSISCATSTRCPLSRAPSASCTAPTTASCPARTGGASTKLRSGVRVRTPA